MPLKKHSPTVRNGVLKIVTFKVTQIRSRGATEGQNDRNGFFGSFLGFGTHIWIFGHAENVHRRHFKILIFQIRKTRHFVM